MGAKVNQWVEVNRCVMKAVGDFMETVPEDSDPNFSESMSDKITDYIISTFNVSPREGVFDSFSNKR